MYDDFATQESQVNHQPRIPLQPATRVDRNIEAAFEDKEGNKALRLSPYDDSAATRNGEDIEMPEPSMLARGTIRPARIERAILLF
jgi:hypothetical protein